MGLHVAGQQEGRERMLIARAFSSAGVAVHTVVGCTGGGLQPTVDEIVEKNVVTIGRPDRPGSERPMSGHNGGMTSPPLAPRSPMGALVTTWAFGAAAALVVGIFAPPDQRFVWMAVGAGASLFVAFVANLADGRADGFLTRTAASVLGALVAMGVISLVFAVTAIGG